MAVLREPVLLTKSASEPTAVFAEAVVLVMSALAPTAATKPDYTQTGLIEIR
jgi:hypothetical protein